MTPLLRVEGVTKTFSVPSGLFGRAKVSAVDDVSLAVDQGEIVGLVGESGSGKTTLARCILGLTRPDRGTIVFDGVDITGVRGAEARELRRRVQPVFQDPFSSLDPRWSVGRSIREALDSFRIGTVVERDAKVLELLDRVGLGSGFAERRPGELSGGQRQRVGIAAALASGPDLIVADEPVSALDVSVQAQVLNLMAELQRDLGVAVLFVAHDLSVVEHISRRVAVMYLGRIAEFGPAGHVFTDPRHPYTRALVTAIPYPDPTRRSARVQLTGEIPSPLDPPAGCRFHPRCPIAVDRCRTDVPVLTAPIDPPVDRPTAPVAPVAPVVLSLPTSPDQAQKHTGDGGERRAACHVTAPAPAPTVHRRNA